MLRRSPVFIIPVSARVRRVTEMGTPANGLPRVLPDEVDDDRGQLLATVLLDEMAATLDDGVGLALGAGDELLDDALAPLGDGVAVAEGGEDGLAEGAQRLPRRAIGRGGRVLGRGGHEQRELARPFLEGLVRE